MEGIWIWFVIIIAGAGTATSLAAIALVSFASLSEDTAHTLFGRSPGRGEAMARRLLGFRAERATVRAGQASARAPRAVVPGR